MAAAYVFLGAFTYGIVYTVWLKRRSTWNIVVGGLAGSFAVLAGAAAVDPSPQVIPTVLAVALFLWTPPHFWSLAAAKGQDYAKAGIPMLPVVVPALCLDLGDPRAIRSRWSQFRWCRSGLAKARFMGWAPESAAAISSGKA